MHDRILVSCESSRKAAPYLEALRLMEVPDAKLLLLTPPQPRGELEPLAAQAAGVVLCGGPDLHPSWYGQEPLEGAKLSLFPDLDRMDWELLEGARKGCTPVWAICRGMQTFNVFQGGSLWQDLPSQVQGALEHDPDGPDDAVVHAVHLVRRRESFARLLARDRIEVNSRHHQAVRDLGGELSIVAQSSDGIIEVLSLDAEDWWVKGVQWHPENLMHLALQRALWMEFLNAAKVHTRRTNPAF